MAASQPTATRFGLRRQASTNLIKDSRTSRQAASSNRPEQTSSGFVRKGARPRVTEYVLSPSCLLRIDVAQVRPQPLGQLTQSRRLIAELDHVQDESIDPRGFVHGRTVHGRAQLRELTVWACVQSGRPGDHGAAPDRKVRALKQVRQLNREPQNTPPLCSRRRLHFWQVRSGD